MIILQCHGSAGTSNPMPYLILLTWNLGWWMDRLRTQVFSLSRKYRAPSHPTTVIMLKSHPPDHPPDVRLDMQMTRDSTVELSDGTSHMDVNSSLTPEHANDQGHIDMSI